MSGLAELIGTRILRQRTRRHLSMRELAGKSGVAINTISRIERGHGAHFDNVAALAAALDLSLDGLVAPSPCEVCDGMPPAGMTCQCGTKGPEVPR